MALGSIAIHKRPRESLRTKCCVRLTLKKTQYQRVMKNHVGINATLLLR